MASGHGLDKYHDFKRGNAIEAQCVWREKERKQEAVAVTSKRQSLSLVLSFGRVPGHIRSWGAKTAIAAAPQQFRRQRGACNFCALYDVATARAAYS
eukprot:6174021-Pleurochrysis_carterae.AAC.1